MANQQPSDEATRAGRGVLLTMAAKGVFIVTGLGVQLALPGILGAEQWGRYATVGAITAIVTNTLVASTVQTVSKRTSEDEAGAGATQREGLMLGLALAVAIGGGFALAAPLLATTWQHDATLAPLFVTAGIVIASYAIYASIIGAINGRRRFAQQARFDMAFAILRSSAIVGGGVLGAATGALAGWAGVAVLIVVIAIAVAGTGTGPGRPALRAWLAFFLPVAAYQACLNGVLQADQPLLRAHVAELALEAGRSAAEATASASSIAGYYRAAQTFAFVPYQLILAVTFVVFPTVSAATSAGDAEARKRAIRGAMRFSSILVLAMAAPVAGASDGVMRIVYREEFVAASDALGVLALGMVPFSLFAIGASILAGSGRAALTSVIAAVSLTVVVAGNAIAVRAAGPGIEATVAAALATSTAAVLALVLTGLAVHRVAGAFVSPLSVVRAVVAALVGAGVAHVVPHDTRLGAIAALALGGAAYLVALALVREIGREDLALVRRILRRGG